MGRRARQIAPALALRYSSAPRLSAEATPEFMRWNLGRCPTPLLVACALSLLPGCSPDQDPPAAASSVPPPVSAPPVAPLFVDVSAEAGLDFVHFNAVAGELYMPEMMGSGAGLIDFDNDGLLDLYLVQGAMLGSGKTPADATTPPVHPLPLSDRLYRNESTAGGPLRLRDVTAGSGLDGPVDGEAVTGHFGMGVAVGDFDGDGYDDLYLANLGPNQLLRNLGNGQFADISESAGIADPRWSVSAAMADLDGDGLLDIYVANYLEFDADQTKQCFSPAGQRDYCGPKAYPPVVNSLYRNLGNGRFADVSEYSGIRAHAGHSLGVTIVDMNGDQRPDIYVANDGMANELWINQGEFQFRNEALLAGVAVNADGMPEAGMGVDAADCDGNGDDDIVLSHLNNEHNTLYMQQGGAFRDETLVRGMSAASWQYTGFGIAFLDYDLDGWLDIAYVNGLVTFLDERERDGPFPLGQPNQLMRNLGECQLAEVSDQVPALQVAETSRGLAVGDLNNDGAPDLLIANAGGPARVLINQALDHHHWLGLQLFDHHGRSALGARATVQVPDGRELVRRVRRDGSYASANDPRVLFGLSDWAGPVDLRVRWADGSESSFDGLEVDRYHRLSQSQAAE